MKNVTPNPNSITLCIICGNEEAVIERMLDSFKDAFDEVCAVQAVGNLTPDKTRDKIAAWAFRNGKMFETGEFKNSEVGADRPHVDDFGAARNQSFAMGIHPWILWADCDDLLSPDGAAAIRQAAAAEPRQNCYGFYYEVSPVRIVPRERLILRGTWKWQHPIHEAMIQVGHKDVIRMAPGATWIHAPLPGKVVSSDRNIWILENKTPAGLAWFANYYISVEYFARGNKVKALSHAGIALSDTRIPQAYRYELTLNMAKLAERREERRQWALRAYDVDPRRREALGYLAICELDEGNPDDALAFSCSMKGLAELPVSQRPMNHEPPCYGWLGKQLLHRSLRAFGYKREDEGGPSAPDAEGVRQMAENAAKFETESFHKHGGKISLLHATRGRLSECHFCRALWFFTAKNPMGIEHIFAVDDDDLPMIEMMRRTGFRHVIVPAGGGCVAAWNAAARASAGDVLVQVSDDFTPPEGWDAAILSRIGDTSKPAVLAVHDGHRQDGLLCIAICTRARMMEQEGGDLFWREYKSLWSDNEFTVRALCDGVVINARDLIFTHHHPIFQGVPMENWDKTYLESNAPDRQKDGHDIFTRRNQGQLDQLKGIESARRAPLTIVVENPGEIVEDAK